MPMVIDGGLFSVDVNPRGSCGTWRRRTWALKRIMADQALLLGATGTPD